MAETKHSPLPWTLSQLLMPVPDQTWCACIYGGTGQQDFVAYLPALAGWTPKLKANAEFMIRACNSHDALVDTCEKMAKWLERLHKGDLKRYWTPNVTERFCKQFRDALAEAK